VTALSKGASVAQLTTEAKSVSGNYNFVNGTGVVTGTVNNPPASGRYVGKTNAVEVIVAQPQTPMVSSLLMSSGPTITSRSVAASVETGSGCVVALDKGDVVDVTDTGSSVLNLNNCSLYINSNDTAALTMKGSAVIDAGAAYMPVCRWIAIVPTPSALSSTIRARHTCFCGLFPDPITASSRSRSPGPSRTSTPLLIQPDSRIRKPAGIIRQRPSSRAHANAPEDLFKH
jgi:hypothetical protein